MTDLEKGSTTLALPSPRLDSTHSSCSTFVHTRADPVTNHSEHLGHSSYSSCSTLQTVGEFDVEAKVKLAFHHEIELRDELRDVEASPFSDELPPLKPLAWWRYAIVNVYRRLFSLVFLGNLAALTWMLCKERTPLDFVNAAAANLLALGLARQPLVVNSMFRLFCAVPRSAPMSIRRWCVKIYCYGGVHSGCGVASLFWYVGFIALLTRQFVLVPREQSFATPAIMSLSYIILSLLIAIIIAAYPKIRFMLHDWFELTHRFCGWAVVVLFWPLLILASLQGAKQYQQTLGQFLLHFPTFWMLLITSLAIIHPWALLRRVKVTPEYLSTHAIRLHFHHTTINFGQGIQLSKHPLRDWHSFATFPDVTSLPGTNGSVRKSDGFSCLISKAGDWTSATIANPPTHLWKRGVPIYGFGYAMRIFSRIIIVTTGSGIGPCLSFLGDPDRPAMRVVWQTKAPLKTYGAGTLDMVHQMDKHPEILDTSKTGRQDMLPLVMRLYREFRAEAVCVISNPIMTQKLVLDCESRGVPAFGPIFDS